MRKSRGAASASATVTLDDVIAMLIQGGYYRAKIRGLSDFDKVAGGLAWGIRNSRFSIDVEFVENSHIREKIRVAESICQALKSEMECPHDLEPHQIQGLDYPKLAVVLEWLLKRVAATREENAHLVAEFTKLDFERRFHLPCCEGFVCAPTSAGADGATNCLNNSISRRLRPLKAPKREMISSKLSYASRLEHSATVLLEYGLKYQLKDSVLLLQSADAEGGGDKEVQRDAQKLMDDERKEQAMLEALLQEMTAHKERNRMATQQVKDLMMQSADNSKIAKMRSAYDARKAELQQRLQQEEDARNALEAQKQRLAELEAEQQALAQQRAGTESELETVCNAKTAATEKSNRKLQRIEEQIDSISEVERMLRSDSARSSLFDHLLALLAEEKELQRKFDDDTAKSKERISDAKQEVVDLAERLEQLGGDEGRTVFEQELASLRDELAAVLNELAKKDQEAMGVTRKIDEYPTRAELQQYEVRISELNEEMAWKFETTRLQYTLHNTRAEVLKCLENEEQVLTQLAGLFETCLGKSAAKKNAAERQHLLEQSSAIVGQLKASNIKQQERLEEAFASIAEAKKSYETLVEQQREYLRLVDSMKSCLEENEALRLETEDDAGEGQEDEGAAA